ncbi:MAG: integrase [Verrucomicrobia bacterium]|nr:integrase [Verrucomicrobiota bacterium]
MKPEEMTSNHSERVQRPKSHRRHSYQKALDGRKQPIRGLYIRNGHFVARISTTHPETNKETTRWFPLLDINQNRITTLTEAKTALNELRSNKAKDKLPTTQRVPTLADYVEEYIEHRKTLMRTGDRRPATIEKDQHLLAKWVSAIGPMRISAIRPDHILKFRDRMLNQGSSSRTANLAVIALRGLLKHAKIAGLVDSLPMQDIGKLREPAKHRALISTEDLSRITQAALTATFHSGAISSTAEHGQPLKNGRQFADYIWLMAYTGARRNEALALRWTDVNFDLGQLTIGSDGSTKNHESRRVDFHPKLEALLREMSARKAPDTQWIFPSPQRGERDVPAKTFMESLKLARTAANMPNFTFHDCRHFFISYAVMSGIDFMTIARWVGHKDGGILIGKVYGHLSNEHSKAQAQRLNFGR